jgi:hypothetical protein
VTAVFFALCGAAVGIAEASVLAGATRLKSHPLSFLARLLLVAGVLVLAARAGHLISGAAGWTLGFGTAAAVAYRRLR